MYLKTLRSIVSIASLEMVKTNFYQTKCLSYRFLENFQVLGGGYKRILYHILTFPHT